LKRRSVIATERLDLGLLTPEDAPFILELLNEAAFLRFIGDKGVRTLADAREYILQGPMDSYRRLGFGLYIVTLRSVATPGAGAPAPGAPVGICGLVKREGLADVDVGFAFLGRYRAQGFASESAAAVLRYGRETVGLPRIVAITAPDNHASTAVLEKIGLQFERRIRLVEGGPELNLFGP
jgi:RimJ/RimL family protein N-acetyltransferase